MEQREIKVCFLHTSMFWFGFLLFAIFIFLFFSFWSLLIHPSCLVVPFALSLQFLFCRHFSYVFFSLFPFCPPGCVSSAHLSSLHLHPPPPIIFFLFLSSVYFSGEYTAGRMFLLFSHSACLLIVRCRQNRLLLVTGLLSRSFQGHNCIPVTSQCGVFLSSQT